MKIRTLLVAATALTAASTFAYAQSSPSPANQSGGGVTNTQSSPTDAGAAGVGGNTRGTPAAGANQMNNRMAPAATTGSSAPSAGSAMQESREKNASPASSAEGAKKQK